MGDWPSVLQPPLLIVSPFSQESLGGHYGYQNMTLITPASGTVTQNQAYFFPFRVDIGATAVKMACVIGATANGNIDVGIYDDGFNYLISSGATAQGTTNTLQEFNITDTYLPPGIYWMAVSLSSATGTVFRSAPSADEVAVSHLPCYQQASAHPLPTTSASPIISGEATPIIAVAMAVAFDTLI